MQRTASRPVAVLGPGRGRAQPSVLLQPSQVSWPPVIFFCKITQISDVFAFPNSRKLGKFAASIERPKTKIAPVSVGGGLCPLADQMFCPWTLLGALPQIFILGWRYRARHGFLPPDVAG